MKKYLFAFIFHRVAMIFLTKRITGIWFIDQSTSGCIVLSGEDSFGIGKYLNN